MRRLLVVVMAASLSTCFKCSPEQKSYVDVPAKLADVKKLAKPPEVVVEVVRQRKDVSGGGGGCGHSAACLILLPIIAYQLAFPEKYDEVTVTDHGEVTFHGLYSTDGDLLSARVKNADGWRELAQLDLPELGQRAIVERAKVKTLADGGEERADTTIASQVDLVGQFRTALEHAKGERRGKLLSEAFGGLGGEGDAMVIELVGKPEEADETKAAVLQKTCNALDAERGMKVVRAAMNGAGPATAKTALGCDRLPDDLAANAGTLLAEALCKANSQMELIRLDPGPLPEKKPAASTAIRAAAEKCPKDGAALALMTLGEKLTVEAWLEALDEPRGLLVVSNTSAQNTDFLFTGLAKRKTYEHELLERISFTSRVLTLEQANTLIDLALAQPRTNAGWERRAFVAKALMQSQPLGPQLIPRLKKIDGANARTGQVFLAMMGDGAARDALANALPPELAERSASHPSTEDEFVLSALYVLGCRRDRLAEGKKAAACN